MMNLPLLALSFLAFFMVHTVYLILAYLFKEEAVNYEFKQALSDGLYLAIIVLFVLFLHEMMLGNDVLLSKYLLDIASGFGYPVSYTSLKAFTFASARALINIGYSLMKGYTWGISQIDVIESIRLNKCKSWECAGGAGSASHMERYSNYVSYARDVGFGDIYSVFTGGVILSLLALAFSPKVEALVYLAVFIRAFPGMKYISNVLLGVFVAYMLIFPILLYIEFSSITYLISPYLGDTETAVLKVAFPDFVGEIKSESNLFHPGFFNALFSGVEAPSLNIRAEGERVCILIGNRVWTCDSLFRKVYFVVYLMAVFFYPLTFVGMAIAAKSVSAMLGEAYSFVEMFIRAV
jgi:hypothetical protein